MTAEIRTHLELQTFARTADLVNLRPSLSEMRTPATSSSSAGHGPTPMEIGWVKGKGQGKGKNKEKGKGKGKSKGKGKKNPRARGARDCVTTAENGVTKLQTVGMENRNKCTKYKVMLVQPAQAVRSPHWCEGGVDVVGVVTPLVRGRAQVLHGDQVVELSVLLEVNEKEEVEEDDEGQIEVEGEDELKEKRSCMTMNVDEMRFKNTLSHEVHVTQTSKRKTKTTRSQCMLTYCELARVGVRVIVLVVDVVCLMLVLSARVVVHAVFVQFS